jgi:hypothetical protein
MLHSVSRTLSWHNRIAIKWHHLTLPADWAPMRLWPACCERQSAAACSELRSY